MNRLPADPRPRWKSDVEKWGLLFHTTESGATYWDESAYYRLSPEDVEAIEDATNTLHRLAVETARKAVAAERWDDLRIPEIAREPIRKSLALLEPSLYGRFDLAYDGFGPPKLLEYNADTPTSLLEAAVIQWKWLEARHPGADQFNSLWEALVARWKDLSRTKRLRGARVWFACGDSLEDQMTTTMLMDTAQEAGLWSESVGVDEIGWDPDARRFVDLEDQAIAAIFKLYPWEWLLADEFGAHLVESLPATQWIEPIWKLLLSNKALLALMWEDHPDCPYLLPAYLDGPRDLRSFVTKPVFSREGANVRIHAEGIEVASEGPYGREGLVYQALAELPSYEGNHPVIGSWVVGEQSCGVGIRESVNLITDDLARFVPHVIR